MLNVEYPWPDGAGIRFPENKHEVGTIYCSMCGKYFGNFYDGDFDKQHPTDKDGELARTVERHKCNATR